MQLISRLANNMKNNTTRYYIRYHFDERKQDAP